MSRSGPQLKGLCSDNFASYVFRDCGGEDERAQNQQQQGARSDDHSARKDSSYAEDWSRFTGFIEFYPTNTNRFRDSWSVHCVVVASTAFLLLIFASSVSTFAISTDIVDELFNTSPLEEQCACSMNVDAYNKHVKVPRFPLQVTFVQQDPLCIRFM